MFIGIPHQIVQRHFAFQEGPQYCWAACTQMVLSLYGEERAQSDIDVRGNGLNLFGWFPDRSGNRYSIENNFNDIFISRFRCTSEDGAPDLNKLFDELQNNRPMIAAYWENPESHHAVLLYGAEYNQVNDRVFVHKIHVADPFPGRGLVYWDVTQFLPSMSSHWLIQRYY